MKQRLALPRTRLVNFRLTEVEYQQLRTASLTSGARGLSEFARSAILDTVRLSRQKAGASEPVPKRVEEHFAEFAAVIHELVEAVNALPVRLIGGMPELSLEE